MSIQEPPGKIISDSNVVEKLKSPVAREEV